MELIKVQSSMIYAAGYDEQCERLELVYFNGVYRYYDVPKELFEGLLAAESKGRYIHETLLNRFPYRLLQGQSREDEGFASEPAVT